MNGVMYRLICGGVLVGSCAVVCWKWDAITALSANYYNSLSVIFLGVFVASLLGVILPVRWAEPLQCVVLILCGMCATTTVLGITP